MQGRIKTTMHEQHNEEEVVITHDMVLSMNLFWLTRTDEAVVDSQDALLPAASLSPWENTVHLREVIVFFKVLTMLPVKSFQNASLTFGDPNLEGVKKRRNTYWGGACTLPQSRIWVSLVVVF